MPVRCMPWLRLSKNGLFASGALLTTVYFASCRVSLPSLALGQLMPQSEPHEVTFADHVQHHRFFPRFSHCQSIVDNLLDIMHHTVAQPLYVHFDPAPQRKTV
jgi:hypothetical protein